MPLAFTAAASVANVATQKKNFESGMATLIIWNRWYYEETIKSSSKKQKGGYLGMLLGTVGARRDKLNVLWILNRQTKIFLRIKE